MAETASPPRPEAGKKPTDDEQIRIVLTGLDKSFEAFGREAAHNERSKNPTGPAWKRIVKSAWNNLTHEYQIVSNTQKRTEELYEEGNALHHHGGDDTAWREAAQERYASDYAEELLRDDETFFKLHEMDNEAANRMQEDVIGLVANRAKGNIPDEESFNAALERMAKEWNEQGISQEYIGEGRALGHNMEKMAMQVKAMADAISGLSDLEKAAKIDTILKDADVVVGEAKIGPEAEIQETTAERVANKLKNVPFLSEGKFAKVASLLTNETVVAGAISVGMYGASRLASMGLTGLGGGAVAALREREALRAERVLAERRLAMGYEATEMPDDAADSRYIKLLRKAGIAVTEEQRRAELEATLMDKVPADEVIAEIGKFYSPEGDLMVTNADKLEEALKLYGRMKARADRGLLDASDVELNKQGTRLFEAQMAIAKLQTDIGKLYSNDMARSVLDIEEDQLEAHLKEALSDEEVLIDKEELEAKKLMDKLMRTRVAQRGVFGGTIGLMVGEAAHSIVGHFSSGSGSSSHAPGNVNGDNHAPANVDGNHAPTEVDGSHAPTEVDGNHAPTEVDGGPSSHAPEQVGGGADNHAPTEVDGNGSHAPENVGSAESETHAPTGVDGNDNHAPANVDGNHAPTEVDGSHAPTEVGGGNHAPEVVGGGEGSGDTVTEELSDRSKVTMPDGYTAEVEGKHMTLTTPEGKTFEDLTLNKDGSLTAEAQDELREGGLKISDQVDIVHGNPEASKVNVSPNEFVQGHKADMTKIGHREWVKGPDEFRLQNRLNGDGSITIDISGMQGSAWQPAAASGHMNVYLSASTGSSGNGFKVPIGENGKATIAANSPIRALFDANGNFQGGYQEVAVTGNSANGADHIAVLATAVGGNKDSLVDSVTTRETFATHNYTITERSGVNINPDLTGFATTLGQAGASAPIYTTLSARKGIGQVPRRTAAASAGAGPSSAGPSASSAGPTSGPGSAGAGPTGGPTPPGPTGAPGSAGAGAGPEATPGTDGFTDSERDTMAGLDAETLNMEDSFKFAGFEDYGEREQKMAMQFINIARADMGDATDPADLARRAQEMADAAEAAATPGMADFYARVSEFLAESAAVAEGVRREKNFFDTLDAEDLDTPSGYGFSGYETRGERERKQATRFIRTVMGDLGGTDRVAIVDEAMARMRTVAATPGLSDAMKDFYARSLGVLVEMRTHLEAEAAEEARRKAEDEERRRAEAATPEGREKHFLEALDAEDLDTPGGYDFKGWKDVDLRQRKLASRFLRQALADVGTGRNRIDIVDRAMVLAGDALVSAETDTTRALYSEVQKVLQRSHDFVSSVEKTEVIDELLKDLESETDAFPFPSRVSVSSDERVNKLVARIYRRVSGGEDFARPTIGNYDAGYPEREGPDSDRIRAQYNKKLEKLVRNALLIVHPDKLKTLGDDLSGVADETRATFAKLLSEYKIKRERDFGDLAKEQQRRERAEDEARRRAAGGA